MLYFFANLCVFKIMHTRIDVIRHNYDYEEREGGPPPSRSCALGKLGDDFVKSNPRARAPGGALVNKNPEPVVLI